MEAEQIGATNAGADTPQENNRRADILLSQFEQPFTFTD